MATSFICVLAGNDVFAMLKMMLTYGQMMFATVLQNDVVSYGHKHKNKAKSEDLALFLVRVFL